MFHNGLVGQRFVWIETNSNLSFITRETMGLISDTNGIVRDGVLKSLHSVEIVIESDNEERVDF